MELTPINDYPTLYEQAKTSLIECANLDECKGWTDKAAAMAMYAKQANDDTLLKMAMRIKLRASKKAGELLNAVPKGNVNIQKVGDHHLSRSETAKENGISEHQQKQFQRIANVPDEEFEQQVESDNPPTLTAMSEQGKKDLLRKMNATKDYPTHWVGALDRLIEQSKKIEPSGLHFYDQEQHIKQKINSLINYLKGIK